MRLAIVRGQMDRIHAHAKEGYPHEVVGILAGDRSSSAVSRVHPLINERADTVNRYRVDGLLVLRAEQGLEAEGLEVVGYYHSHPDHPAQYSDYDRDHALPHMSYLITAVHDGEITDTRSWRLEEDRSEMREETIQIEE